MTELEKQYQEIEKKAAADEDARVKRYTNKSKEIILEIAPLVFSCYQQTPPKNYLRVNINGEKCIAWCLYGDGYDDDWTYLYLLDSGKIYRSYGESHMDYKVFGINDSPYNKGYFEPKKNILIIDLNNKEFVNTDEAKVEYFRLAEALLKEAQKCNVPQKNISKLEQELKRALHNKSPETEKKSCCYIATAVYGSYEAPEVRVLRRFRDEVLQNSSLGRLFISTYYKLSPPVAERLKGAQRSNHVVKSLLDRWVERLRNTRGY